MTRGDDISSVFLGMVLTSLLYRDVKASPFRAAGAPGLSGLLNPICGPPGPRPWYSSVDWTAVLGGPPVEICQCDW